MVAGHGSCWCFAAGLWGGAGCRGSVVWSLRTRHSHAPPFPPARLGSAGSRKESMNVGAGVSKHGLSGSRAVGQEQRHTSVPTCAKVGAGGRSWQCLPAWQGSCGPDLSGFENRTGTRRTLVFSSGAGTGPSGCSWDVTASQLPRQGGPCSDTLGSLAVPLHRAHFVLRRQSPKLSPSCPAARLARGAPLGPPAGMSGSCKGTAYNWKPCWMSPQLTCPVRPGEVREFVPLLDAKCDSCPWWCRALN